MHLFVWLVTVMLFLAFESGALPTMYFQPDVEQAYALQVVAVALTLLGSYVSMRLMAFSGVKQSVRSQEEMPALHTYATLCIVRTLLVAIAIWYNLLVYYLADFIVCCIIKSKKKDIIILRRNSLWHALLYPAISIMARALLRP